VVSSKCDVGGDFPAAIPEICLIRGSGAQVYRDPAMNEYSSNTQSTSAAHHGLTAEAISRRAYELWQQEGCPESRDLHHWLRAEQELLAEQSQGGSANRNASSSSSRPANMDTQPLQGTRAASAANRESATAKRTGSAGPFSGEKRATVRSTQGGMRSNGR
jgi:hypothetical protein